MITGIVFLSCETELMHGSDLYCWLQCRSADPKNQKETEKTSEQTLSNGQMKREKKEEHLLFLKKSVILTKTAVNLQVLHLRVLKCHLFTLQRLMYEELYGLR